MRYLIIIGLVFSFFQNLAVAQFSIDDVKNWALIKAGPYTSGENNEVLQIDYNYDIMKTEVTNKQFVDFLNNSFSEGNIKVFYDMVYGYFEGDATHPEDSLTFFATLESPIENLTLIEFDGHEFSVDSLLYNFPVVNVTWFGADAFVKYYNLRLPSKGEWEKSARGMTGWKYPWGNSKDFNRVNLLFSGDPYEDYLTPVAFYDGTLKNGYQTQSDTSVYGIHDLIGNVDEWTTAMSASGYRMKAGGSCGFNWFPTAYDFQGLNSHNSAGYTTGFRCVRQSTVSGVEKSEVINKFQLEQNYPNPFNPSTKIKYSINKSGNVKIYLFDILGNEVAKLVDEYKEVGSYEIEFVAKKLSNGIYFYKISSGKYTETKKMVVLK